MIGWLKRVREQWAAWHRRRLFPESRVLVALDEGMLRCTWPGKEPTEITLADLKRVAIATTDAGPYKCDVFWILEDTDGTHITVPKGATGENDLVDYVLNLDGFDHMLMVMAMGSTSNKVYECWKA